MELSSVPQVPFCSPGLGYVPGWVWELVGNDAGYYDHLSVCSVLSARLAAF